MKRCFDLIVSLTALLLLLPVFLIVAAGIYASLGRPVFFRQLRPGLHGKIFPMYKFRSMLELYDEFGNPLPNEQRLTPFGRFIRKTSLDELPGLFNVIRGDMSLVGPRPLKVEYLELYSAEQSRRHDVKPGITGWAQVNGRNNISWEKRFELDVWYVDHHNLWIDLKILWLTLWRVFAARDTEYRVDEIAARFTGNKDK